MNSSSLGRCFHKICPVSLSACLLSAVWRLSLPFAAFDVFLLGGTVTGRPDYTHIISSSSIIIIISIHGWWWRKDACSDLCTYIVLYTVIFKLIHRSIHTTYVHTVLDGPLVIIINVVTKHLLTYI